MRSIIPLVIIAGLAVATPTPLSPSVRQNAYDIAIDASDYANEHPGCGSLLEDGCNPLRLQATELLTGDSESGLLGANTQIAGLHLRHVKRDGLLGGITNINKLGDQLASLKDGEMLPSLDRPLGGIGIKRDPFTSAGSNKRLLSFGRPAYGYKSGRNTCSTGRRYCCRNVRKYSDSRNAELLDGSLVQDGVLNDVLVGLTCDLLASTLAPESCDNHAVCCTSQRSSKEGIINLGCTPWGVDVSI